MYTTCFKVAYLHRKISNYNSSFIYLKSKQFIYHGFILGILTYTNKGKGVTDSVHWNYFTGSYLLRLGILRGILLKCILLVKILFTALLISGKGESF